MRKCVDAKGAGNLLFQRNQTVQATLVNRNFNVNTLRVVQVVRCYFLTAKCKGRPRVFIFSFYLTKQVPHLHLCCSRDEFVPILNMFQTCFYCKHNLNKYLYMVTRLHALNGIKILA